MRHIFLSPHMDDAIFSAGSLLVKRIQEHQDVRVMTVFTSFGTRPISWDAQKYLIRSGFFRISSFSAARKKEDDLAMTALGIPYQHLDFTDGGFRKDKQNHMLYPTFRHLFSGVLRPEDIALVKTVKQAIQPYVKKSDILYAPLGIGTHADHLIINQVVQSFPNTTYFWLDQPYAGKKKNIFADGKYKKAFAIKHSKHKDRLIRCYTSQTRHLYPYGIPSLNEIFFTP